MKTPPAASDRLYLWLVVTFSFIPAISQFNVTILAVMQPAYAAHEALVTGAADAPQRYRILVPYLIEGFRRLMPASLDPVVVVALGYLLYFLMSTTFTLMVLYGYLRIWFAPLLSLVGVLIASLSMIFAFGDGYFQPWSKLEIGLVTLGLLCVYHRRHLGLLAVVMVATLNRETGVFIALAYPLLAGWPPAGQNLRSLVAWSGVYIAVAAGILLGLRWLIGPAPSLAVAEIVDANFSLAGLAMAALNTALFLGAFWVAAVAGYRLAPEFVRRSWRIVPVYLLAIAIWGVWREVRLLTPLYPILIPSGLAYLRSRAGD